MQTHNLQQGSEAWHQFRATHFGASEAAAMLGLSKYKTRSELLHEKHTGLAKEHSELTQAVFARGHETEAMARPLIEAMIGESLSPVTCSDGKLSCSCDGITFDDEIAWEHKQDANALFSQVARGEMPEEHIPQCQQVLMITGAKKLIFTVSNGTPERMTSLEVYPDPAWFERIKIGWRQFAYDLAAYIPREIADKPQAAPTMQLPALFIQVEGSFQLTTNLVAFGEQLKMFVDRLEMKPTTDQQFADSEEAVKTLEKAEALIKAQEAGALAQMGSIDEMRRTAALYLDIARTARLSLEKAIKAQKDAIRIEAIATVKAKYAQHLAGLEAEIVPIKLVHNQPNWSEAIKGLRKLDTLHDALDSKLAQAKIEMDGMAKDMRAKLFWIHGEHDAYMFLFADLQSVMQKPMDDFKLFVEARISQYKAVEAAKQEALRAKIQVEEEAKAKVRAEAEAARIKAEQEKDQRAKPQVSERERANTVAQDQVAERQSSPPSNVIAPAFTKRPSKQELIECVAEHFGVSYGQACDWILEIAETMKEAA